MCGIAGSVTRNNTRVIENMLTSINHRGKDDSGVYVKEFPNFFLALGHQRLSIIDTTCEA